MGRHILHLALKIEVQGDQVQDGESTTVLDVVPDQAHHLLLQLRNETLADLDALSAEEFIKATATASNVNTALKTLEDLGIDGDYAEEEDE